MAQIRLIPSTYYLSDTSYLSVSNASNMYANTDSTTYSTVTNGRNSTTSYYIYLRGFNFDDVPSNAIINSFTVKLKARESGVSTSSSYQPYLANGTNAINGSCSPLGTTEQTYTFNGISADWDTIKGYGSDFGIRINCRRASRNTTGYVYIYGAEILVDYTIPVYHNVSVTNNSEVATVTPSSQQSIIEGEDCVITFTGIESSNDIIVTDNNVDVTDQLTYVTLPPTGSDSTVLGTYALVSGGFNSYDGGEEYFSGLQGNGVDAAQTTSNYYSNGSNNIAVFTYDFNFSDIPQSATITRVYCQVNGHAESTSSDSEYMCAQLILNTTGNTISDELNFKSIGTSNSTQTIEATTLPTVSQLSGLKLMCRLGYYGGAINGATCYVEYTTPSDPYYAYTISNISADHVISIDDAAGGTYYEVNASSTYTGATTSPSTQSIREGRSATVNIGVANLYEIIVKDNGTDVTSSVTGASGSYTYTVSNVQAVHTITVEENTNYSVTVTSTYTGATVSANPTKVYNGRSSTITVSVQNLYEINITDNGNDVKSSLVGSNGTYTYTITNIQTAHTISVTEATYYNLVAGSSHDTATISPATMKVYQGQNAVFTINGNVSNLVLKDNGVDVTASISNGTYTITDVTAVHTLTILNKPADHIKIDGSYKKVGKVFKKIDGVWVEINKTAFDDFVSTNIMMYGGNISISEIGNVETNGEVVNININNNALSTGTYKLIYEDEHREPLDNVDKITEFTI